MKKKKLRKSSFQIIGGVCGGLAAYFNVEPVFVRLAFLLLPSTLFIYVALMFLMDEPET